MIYYTITQSFLGIEVKNISICKFPTNDMINKNLQPSEGYRYDYEKSTGQCRVRNGARKEKGDIQTGYCHDRRRPASDYVYRHADRCRCRQLLLGKMVLDVSHCDNGSSSSHLDLHMDVREADPETYHCGF